MASNWSKNGNQTSKSYNSASLPTCKVNEFSFFFLIHHKLKQFATWDAAWKSENAWTETSPRIKYVQESQQCEFAVKAFTFKYLFAHHKWFTPKLFLAVAYKALPSWSYLTEPIRLLLTHPDFLSALQTSYQGYGVSLEYSLFPSPQ